MIRYILKRLLLFFPTLGIMSLFVFYFSQFSQEDQLLQLEENNRKTATYSVLQEWDKNYQKAKQLGFHKAAFYFSIYRKSSTDTLNRIQDPTIRDNMANLAYELGDWNVVNEFYTNASQKLRFLPTDQQSELVLALRKVRSLEHTNALANFKDLNERFKNLKKSSNPINNFAFTFRWNGIDNQYHYWLMNVFQGNFGQSVKDNSSVSEKISNSITWTLILSFFSLLVSFVFAIPAAFYSAFNPTNWLNVFLDKLFFLFYALPNFWVATLLILFFASGDFFDWFPTYGLGYARNETSLWEMIALRAEHLILPIAALSYGSIAFIYKQLKNSIQEELQKDYILTAKAKGLSISSIQKNQLLKNASFPLITIVGGIIPALFSGSFIIEYIFSIPGMGKLSVDSILTRDFNSLYILLLLATFFSMLGLLIADLLYYFADPRVQFSSKHSKQ